MKFIETKIEFKLENVCKKKKIKISHQRAEIKCTRNYYEHMISINVYLRKIKDSRKVVDTSTLLFHCVSKISS